MYKIPRPVRCKNKEKYTPKKNNHTQDSIYVVRQFAYVQNNDFYILRSAIQFFSLKNDIKTLTSKTTIFISYAQDSQWAKKKGQTIFVYTRFCTRNLIKEDG